MLVLLGPGHQILNELIRGTACSQEIVIVIVETDVISQLSIHVVMCGKQNEFHAFVVEQVGRIGGKEPPGPNSALQMGWKKGSPLAAHPGDGGWRWLLGVLYLPSIGQSQSRLSSRVAKLIGNREGKEAGYFTLKLIR